MSYPAMLPQCACPKCVAVAAACDAIRVAFLTGTAEDVEASIDVALAALASEDLR